MKIPRVLLPDRVLWHAAAGSTAMGATWAEDGTRLPARVRRGARRAKTTAGEVFVSVATVVLDTEVGVGDRLIIDGAPLRVRTSTPRMGSAGPMGWEVACSE